MISETKVFVFVAVAGLVLFCAMSGGGYDLVVRQELALAVWWVLLLGVGLKALPRSRPSGIALAAIGVLVAFAVWTAVSLVWSDSAERTWAEIARVVAHVGVFLLVLLAVDRRTWVAAAAGLLFAAIAVCAVGLASRLAPDAFPSDVVAGSFSGGRLSYPLNYWNAVGAWGAMTATLALAWSAHAERDALRVALLACVPLATAVTYLSYSRGAVVALAVGLLATIALGRRRLRTCVHALAAAAGTTLVVLAIRSEPAIARGTGGAGAGRVVAALALAAGACALVAVARPAWPSIARAGSQRNGFTRSVGGGRGAERSVGERAGSRRTAARRLAAAAIAVAVLVGVVVTIVVAPAAVATVRERFEAPLPRGGGDPATHLTTLGGNRSELWASALSAGERWPLHGSGAGTFEFWWNRDARDPEYVRDAHSLYLETLAELGWPGLVALLAFVALAVGGGWWALRGLEAPQEAGVAAGLLAAGAVYLVQAGVDWLWEATAVSVLGLACLAVCLAAANRRTVRLGAAPRLAFGVAALAACLVQLPGLAATSEVRASQDALRRGDIERAYAHGNDAVASMPWAATPRVQRALVAEQAGDLAVAHQDMLAAERREPTNWRHPLLLARLSAGLGRPQEALREYRDARNLRPLGAALKPPPASR